METVEAAEAVLNLLGVAPLPKDDLGATPRRLDPAVVDVVAVLDTEGILLPPANNRLGGAAIFGTASGKTKSIVVTSSSSAISFKHHLSNLLNPPKARMLIHRFLR